MLLLVFSATTAFSQNTHQVRFSWGIENLPENFNSIKQQRSKVAAEELVQGKFVRYIHFSKTLTASERSEATTLGMEVLGYIYPATYLVMLPENIDFQQFEKFAPQSIVPLKPEWKMAKSLREPPYGAWALHGDWIDVNLQVYPNLSIPAAAAMCLENGMVVLKQGNQNGFIQVRILKDELPVLAALSFIQFMELVPPPGEKEDTRGRSLHRSNLLDVESPLGKKYNGDGVRTLVRDDGQLGPHIDFQGRLYNQAIGAPTAGTHGDGVGGIIGGAGNLDPSKKGMASGADVFTLDYINDFQDQTLGLHLTEDVTITNSSYSDGCNVGYTLATQTVDQQLYEHQTLMHVFSAGNSNGQDCNYGAGAQWGNITGGHKMAKNAIATANLLPNALLDATSSRGPAYDGRLKPDIAANGTNHFSTNPNNEYQEFGGTSGAAPGIAGCLAQLTQAYKTMHGGQEPINALLKAAILNTANDLGNVGPDFQFGWGHINTWRALSLLEQNRHQTAQVDQGAETTHTVQIPNGTRQAKIMIVWADPPTDPGAERALLNDLDLRVVSPNGTSTYLPWKLDPTPDPDLLNTPAGNGRDSLNNVEQVAINDPAAGAYTVYINGTDVPLGPQEYHLVWEFLSDDIKITYPSGGEGFVAGEVERIHWDAYGTATSFTLRYSTDDGMTFNPITTVTGEKRQYDWTVPNTVNGQIRLLLIRGGKRDTTDFPGTISPIPQNIEISKVCPDSMTISWNEINDSLSYEVYLLGAKYMEIVGTSDTNFLEIPITNAGVSQWVSVRSSHASGIHGRRALAVNWPGELKNCPQQNDLGVRTLLEPGGDAIVSCSATSQAVSVRINNEGLGAITGAQISYQVDNLPVVTEAIPAILPGAALDFTFQTPIAISSNGVINLKVWSQFPGDITNFNDTLSIALPVVTEAFSGVFKEGFEASSLQPLGWLINNPDEGTTWALTNAYPTMVGINGDPTKAFFMNHFQYQERGEMDDLYMIPVDLSSVVHPELTFDLAHSGYDDSYSDGLRVELFPNCDLSADPVVLFEKFDPELGTVTPRTQFFVPGFASDWKRQRIDLGDYAGQTAVIRFVGVNDYGNNTFIDNIGIQEFIAPVIPVAEFLSAADTVCRQDTTIFSANQITPNVQYTWSFGQLSNPTTATGPGPHSVFYLTAGSKAVRLIASNADGADTVAYTLIVRPFPTANFTQAANNLTVTFNNTSANASDYSWDFGDGMTSVLPNPVHTYATPGTFVVKLDATNVCKTTSKTLTLALTSKVNDLSEQLGINILPNPTAGDFIVEIDSKLSDDMQLSLLDAQGRLVKTINQTLKHGVTNIPFEGLDLPKGIYQLNLMTKTGQATFSIAVQ